MSEFLQVLFFFFWLFLEKRVPRDSPGGPGVGTPPCRAGDVGLLPGRGTEVLHAAEELRLKGSAAESPCLPWSLLTTPLSPQAPARESTLRNERPRVG